MSTGRGAVPSGPTRFWGSRHAVGLVVLGAVAAYFLLSEHRAHFFGALPFLLFLACPLMHIFMHRGHDGRHGGPVRHPDDAGADGPSASARRTEVGEQP
ncbi:DUF2933 domain-containing protein [Piscinibacter koreensis]|uniref:DUF2933 domain-containing protein n=1 Tax=Piscinibacter koreensis TaxID=2742824 RepID=A0A7Y6NSK3_9BURK|nr:DUF2933 domain-containing protein [Schlegelella koreensis]NUZ08518.1 DUF2933 domain-containing protein [Schlegelella koreensis]